MIRIVGVQRSDNIGQEFILLQNQGSMRAHLKGHAVISEAALTDAGIPAGIHLFTDDVDIMPGQYVLLRSCSGSGRWSTTTEGQRVFYAYMGRLGTVWESLPGPLHILAPQHTFCERPVEAVLV